MAVNEFSIKLDIMMERLLYFSDKKLDFFRLREMML